VFVDGVGDLVRRLFLLSHHRIEDLLLEGRMDLELLLERGQKGLLRRRVVLSGVLKVLE